MGETILGTFCGEEGGLERRANMSSYFGGGVQ